MKCSKNKVKLSAFDSILYNKNNNINVKNYNINMTSSIYNVKFENNYISNVKSDVDATVCYTAAFVNCGNKTLYGDHYTPLWNVHVHSKHTMGYNSMPCDCNTAVDLYI
jgi:hypothetical protein